MVPSRILFIVVACVLASCETPYQEMGALGGVSAQPITDGVFRVKVRGNAYTDDSKVQDYFLLKAAETTARNGGTHFLVLGSQDTTKTGAVVVPGSATTTANVYGAGNYAYGSATTTYTPPQSFGFVKPGMDVMIKVLDGRRVPLPAEAIDAGGIIRNLGPQYGSAVSPPSYVPVSTAPAATTREREITNRQTNVDDGEVEDTNPFEPG